ncbi:hypothetical protein [Hymenobacter cheonanensis]|uniref:hypothetical protein n=1 Tax=Hymenobacter sp. CA2-7 TaxID=3063993 RepID=UPI002712DA8C|nr:hypothetical protein [Hymenobacter sp. CA2-7]MDO7884207.1 hypothetical protein [Hymenobacter sp. CA2-7]
MKATLFAAALALTASAALAQTVAPGTTPGAQTGNPTNMPSAGSTTDQTTTTSGRMDNMSGMSHSDKKAMRKSKKMKSSDGSMKTKTKM